MQWLAHVTVATVVQDQDRFLFVEEVKQGRDVLNQPAGHLEADETLGQAAIRETLEETGWHVELTGVVGIYLYTAPSNGVTYQRVCFAARPVEHDGDRPLDEGIVGARWLSRAELLERRDQLRSELVLRCVDDFLAGPVYPLDVIRD